MRALVRPGSAPKLPAGTESVVGDALTAFEALILVSLHQMIAALVAAVEYPVDSVRFAGVPEIRDAGRRSSPHEGGFI